MSRPGPGRRPRCLSLGLIRVMPLVLRHLGAGSPSGREEAVEMRGLAEQGTRMPKAGSSGRWRRTTRRGTRTRDRAPAARMGCISAGQPATSSGSTLLRRKRGPGVDRLASGPYHPGPWTRSPTSSPHSWVRPARSSPSWSRGGWAGRPHRATVGVGRTAGPDAVTGPGGAHDPDPPPPRHTRGLIEA